MERLPDYLTVVYEHSPAMVVCSFGKGDRYMIYVATSRGWKQVATALSGDQSLKKYSKAETLKGRMEEWCNITCLKRYDKREARRKQLWDELKEIESEMFVYNKAFQQKGGI